MARRRFGVELPYESQRTWGITRLRPQQLAAAVAETHDEKHVLAAEPYAGAVEVVRRWHATGHEIVIVSRRDQGARDVTERWLRQIGLPFAALHCREQKVAACLEERVDLLIDDSPPVLEDALAAGLRVATILHPWNRDFCEEELVLCAEDWPALAARLSDLLGTQASAA